MRGITAAQFLKRIRLVHAYDMLAEACSRTTVTKVCAKCGFGNLGHFARDYRSEFGELPSDILLRARMRHRALSRDGNR
ncbi:helix-turn-helix domain-containing protein [Bradyrhizobium cajani]|nr:helix-turn-helix domain-containing protein [Bradyrhizobium cajani]